MADNTPTYKSLEEIGDAQTEQARIVREDGYSPEEKTAARAKLAELSKLAGETRKKEIADIKDPKEKQIIELYEKGVQNYAIAQKVYDGMVNTETVGRVIAITRKHYANDYNEVEEVNSTKGYNGQTGV